MTTIIFVHGTGTRDPGYTATLNVVAKRLKPFGVDVRRCYWGGELGTKLRAGGKSIPRHDETRSVGGPNETEVGIVLWEQLYRDPLFELRLFARESARASDSDAPVPGGRTAAIKAGIDRVFVDSAGVPLSELLATAGAAAEFADACVQVRDEKVLVEAALAAENEQALLLPVARALVATVIQLADEKGENSRLSLDAKLRDQLEAAIAEVLRGNDREMGLVGDIFSKVVIKPLAGLAAHVGTTLIKRRRGAIFDAATPGAGDVLFYQTRGQAIRDFIQAEVEAAPGPVILLAHSLGGIACVDALIERKMKKVRALITVGSQAPFFYEIDALDQLAFSDDIPVERRLPDHFPKTWLNIYDLRDFLSYVGRDIFGERVIDIRVDNGQPFPAAHSAYWYNDAVWEQIFVEVKKTESL